MGLLLLHAGHASWLHHSAEAVSLSCCCMGWIWLWVVDVLNVPAATLLLYATLLTTLSSPP